MVRRPWHGRHISGQRRETSSSLCRDLRGPGPETGNSPVSVLALQGHAEELRPLARSFIADRKSVVTENLYERAPAVANGRKKRLIWNVKSSKADQPSSEDRWESFRGFWSDD